METPNKITYVKHARMTKFKRYLLNILKNKLVEKFQNLNSKNVKLHGINNNSNEVYLFHHKYFQLALKQIIPKDIDQHNETTLFHILSGRYKKSLRLKEELMPELKNIIKRENKLIEFERYLDNVLSIVSGNANDSIEFYNLLPETLKGLYQKFYKQDVSRIRLDIENEVKKKYTYSLNKIKPLILEIQLMVN